MQTGSTDREDVILTGYPSLDVILGGGIRNGELIVLGGDTGSGKSAMALSIAANASRDNQAIFYSSEMRPERLRERLVAMRAGISIAELRSIREADPDDLDATASGGDDSDSALHLRIMPEQGAVDEIARDLVSRPATNLVIVDHLQGMSSGQTSRAEEHAAVVNRLKALAVRSNTAVLLVAFCATDRTRAPVARPTLQDFGALGSVGENADVALALFREELYDDARGIDGAAELHVLKNRHGGTGYVDLYFHKKWLRFEDMIDPA
jgi:replicative DNA helicase